MDVPTLGFAAVALGWFLGATRHESRFRQSGSLSLGLAFGIEFGRSSGYAPLSARTATACFAAAAVVGAVVLIVDHSRPD